jgi:hypothetical protein
MIVTYLFLYLDARSLTQDEANTLKQWLMKQFGDKIKNVKVRIIFDRTCHIFSLI